MQLILKGQFDFDGEEWLTVSSPAKVLIKSILNEVKNRIKITEILTNEWVKIYLQKEKELIGKEKALQVFNKEKLL